MHLPLTFLQPAMFLLSIVALGMLLTRSRRQAAVRHSQVRIHQNLTSFPAISRLPTLFYLSTVLSMVALLAWAVLPEQKEKRFLDTRDVLLAVDNSGSMGTAIPGGAPEGLDWTEKNGAFRRLDLAQYAVEMFTARRQGDRVGLMVFDTRTYKHWPLTDDLKIILRKAKLISKHVGGGTDFEGPEGPIQSAIEHFKDYGKAKTKVLIFVTDGEAPIDDERMEELVSQMKEIGGKIYVLGVGEDWTDPNSSSASQTEPLKKLVSRLGGKCFAVGDAKQMQEALLVVDELEKSRISTEHSTTFRDAYQYFAAAAVVSLALLSLSVLVTREVI